MTRQSWLETTLFFMLCLLLIQCSGGIQKKPTSVILITLDTQRADYVSAYRSELASTPNIDYFAQKGILYENCYSLIPITAPAHASLFYSLPPHLLQLYNNGQVLHPDKKRTSIAELFRQKGFQTAAFISLGVLKSRFELHHGFDLYDDIMLAPRWYLTAQEINDKVFPWLDKNRGQKFFIWIHYSDPHDPYAPPSLAPDLRINLNGKLIDQICLQKYENLDLKLKLHKGSQKLRFTVLNPYPDSEDQSRAALNEIEFIHPESVKLSFKNIQFVHRGTKQSALIKTAGTILIDCYEPDVELAIKARGNLNMHPSEKTQAYRQEVEYMDHQIGRLTDKLKEMNLLDECLIVLVGDHGEGLGEIKTKYGDRYFGHIHYLYGAHTKVPLIFYDPTSVKQAERITEMTSILDVTPTILGRMRWKKKPYHKGRDLFKRKKTRLSILEETYTPEAIYDRFGMLQYPWHMIYTPETQLYELYQLAMDPGEKENMYEQQKHAAEIKKIQEMLIQKASEILKLKIEVKIDEKSLEMLKSLGYIK